MAPQLTATQAQEPNKRPFTIMPAAGELLRIIDIYPPQQDGNRTVMHRTRTLHYMVVIEGEVVLVLDDGEVTLRKRGVVMQRGTDHAWENRSDQGARMACLHIDARCREELLSKLSPPRRRVR